MSKEAVDILDYIHTEHAIECQGIRCANNEIWYGDEVEFCKDLWKRGWRISRQGTLYCPDCVKAKLKKKK